MLSFDYQKPCISPYILYGIHKEFDVQNMYILPIQFPTIHKELEMCLPLRGGKTYSKTFLFFPFSFSILICGRNFIWVFILKFLGGDHLENFFILYLFSPSSLSEFIHLLRLTQNAFNISLLYFLLHQNPQSIVLRFRPSINFIFLFFLLSFIVVFCVRFGSVIPSHFIYSRKTENSSNPFMFQRTISILKI